MIGQPSFGWLRLGWHETWDSARPNCEGYNCWWSSTNSNSGRHGMGIFALAADERVANVRCTEDTLAVDLMDGRTIIVPLAWYPRLLNATPAQRERWQISGGGYGIHWTDLDEDLSTEGLLRGAPSPGFTPAESGDA
jgi:hypothetical protein